MHIDVISCITKAYKEHGFRYFWKEGDYKLSFVSYGLFFGLYLKIIKCKQNINESIISTSLKSFLFGSMLFSVPFLTLLWSHFSPFGIFKSREPRYKLGLFMRWTADALYGGLYLPIYELFKYFFLKDGANISQRFFLAYIALILSSLVSYPFLNTGVLLLYNKNLSIEKIYKLFWTKKFFFDKDKFLNQNIKRIFSRGSIFASYDLYIEWYSNHFNNNHKKQRRLLILNN